MGQREKWTPMATLIACKAYIESSMDAKRGNAQKCATFSKRVHSCYMRLIREFEQQGEHFDKIDKERSATAPTQRFRKVKEMSLKFEGYAQRVLSLNLTGNTCDADILRIATAM